MAAQPTPLSRADAVGTALGRAARLGIAVADTAAAYAQLPTARAWQNPTLSTAYSRSTPRYHVTADIPFDLPGLRGARIRSAQAGRDAARLRLAFERGAVALGADTAYTRALAGRERLRLSRRNASAADSLRVIAEKRRDAGDASDLDVELAAVNAGQQANVAATDSLTYLSALLDLQTAIGLPADGVAITPADSLTPPPVEASPEESPDATALPAGFLLAASRPPTADAPATRSGIAPSPVAAERSPSAAPPLSVAAARASLEGARLATQVERRSVWAAPSITAGFETGDPSGDEDGILPTVGISIPLPLLSRNRGPIARAEAERARASAELRRVEVESRAEIARARRALAIALDKVRRDQALVAAAERVAAKSITAYREGASALPNVLEAQRNARDVLAQYVDDMAEAWVAAASLRVLTLTASAPSPIDASR